MYKNIIVGYFDNNILSEKIYNKKNSYENIIKVYEEWKNK